MKVLLLSDIRSVHTLKWANSLQEKGIEVILFGLLNKNCEKFHPSIKIFSHNIASEIAEKEESGIQKLNYLKALPFIRRIIKEEKPDIVHSHYISSYGLLGVLSGFKPLVSSVWGTDIVKFPRFSPLHKAAIKYVLSKSTKILATSDFLANEIGLYSSKNVEITHFGVDISKFNPKENSSNDNEITIGIVKNLESNYGIDLLLKVFSSVISKVKDKKVKLIIAGDGTKASEFKEIAQSLNLNGEVKFLGRVPNNEIQSVHNLCDFEVYPSLFEAFGVSVIEASACGVPVIATNIGGLPAIIINNETGLLIEPGNFTMLEEAMLKMINDKDLREKLGKAARNHIVKNYNFDDSVNKVISIYNSVLTTN